jgi:hypothetical protein
MHQSEAYAAFQSFILRWQYCIDYATNEGTVRLWASEISVDVDKNNYPVYKGVCTYEFDPRKPNYILDQVIWTHRMVAETRKLAFPVVPQDCYAPPGVVPIPYSGVNWDKEKRNFEGVDCYAPAWRMTAKQQKLASLVDYNYLLMIHCMRPCVNGTPFRGYPPGTVLYLGADFDEAPLVLGENHVVDITHHFIVEENILPFITPEGIPVTKGKGGHDYLWTSTYLGTGNIPYTNQVNVATMYNYAELNNLGLT